jgi:hypothetical protein
MSATTERRAPIRVLVRGVTFQNVGDRLAGHAIALLGPATQEDWPGTWSPGDVEGIVWVTTSRVNERIAELRNTPGVVDVRLTMRDVT